MTDDIRFWVDEARWYAAHERRVLELMEQHLFGYPAYEVETITVTEYRTTEGTVAWMDDGSGECIDTGGKG